MIKSNYLLIAILVVLILLVGCIPEKATYSKESTSSQQKTSGIKNEPQTESKITDKNSILFNEVKNLKSDIENSCTEANGTCTIILNCKSIQKDKDFSVIKDGCTRILNSCDLIKSAELDSGSDLTTIKQSYTDIKNALRSVVTSGKDVKDACEKENKIYALLENQDNVQQSTPEITTAEELLNLNCNNNKNVADLTVFNLKEDELPELVRNFFHEKNSWGEEFRKLIFPQPERQYTDQATASDIAELANRMGYWPPDGVLTTPIEFVTLIPEKYKTWELVSYSNFGTVNLIAEKYPTSEKASQEFKKKFESIKKDTGNIKVDIGNAGEESFFYYREVRRYGQKEGEDYIAQFRINNILFTMMSGYGNSHYLNSKEKLISTLNDKYGWICSKFH